MSEMNLKKRINMNSWVKFVRSSSIMFALKEKLDRPSMKGKMCMMTEGVRSQKQIKKKQSIENV